MPYQSTNNWPWASRYPIIELDDLKNYCAHFNLMNFTSCIIFGICLTYLALYMYKNVYRAT